MMADQDNLAHLGFTFDIGGAHIARTMMFDELAAVLCHVDQESASAHAYIAAMADGPVILTHFFQSGGADAKSTGAIEKSLRKPSGRFQGWPMGEY